MIDNSGSLCYSTIAVDDSCGLVAQLDRVFDYESKGRGFESRRAHQMKSHPLRVVFHLVRDPRGFEATTCKGVGKGLKTAGGGNFVIPFLSRNKRSPLWGVAPTEHADRTAAPV